MRTFGGETRATCSSRQSENDGCGIPCPRLKLSGIRRLRRECLAPTVNTVLGMYLEGRLDEFDRLREPLRTLMDIPLVASLLEFDPCRRRFGRAHLWADAIKVALHAGPLRCALARAYRRQGWHCRHNRQFLRAVSAFAHAIALEPGNKYSWRWLGGSMLRRQDDSARERTLGSDVGGVGG